MPDPTTLKSSGVTKFIWTRGGGPSVQWSRL